MQKSLELLGFILASNVRLNIFLKIAEGGCTPKLISKGLDMSLTQVSNSLRDLRERGLVECANPDAKKGRVYYLTDDGRDIYPELLRIIGGIKDKRI